MGFEILEHTADVGIRATSDTLSGVFEEAAAGLLEITGARRTAGGRPHSVHLVADDVEGLLVDWLNEILFLQDSRDQVITGIEIDDLSETSLRATIYTAPRGSEMLEGTQVKAVTYHQLAVERTDHGWVAEVFVDV
ncbi:MAG TPA: archease [Actinomycetota bacterium]|jgi:SHS2 domain-containing protein|nr:archease [Actinomycetota bacterium]